MRAVGGNGSLIPALDAELGTARQFDRALCWQFQLKVSLLAVLDKRFQAALGSGSISDVAALLTITLCKVDHDQVSSILNGVTTEGFESVEEENEDVGVLGTVSVAAVAACLAQWAHDSSLSLRRRVEWLRTSLALCDWLLGRVEHRSFPLWSAPVPTRLANDVASAIRHLSRLDWERWECSTAVECDVVSCVCRFRSFWTASPTFLPPRLALSTHSPWWEAAWIVSSSLSVVGGGNSSASTAAELAHLEGVLEQIARSRHTLRRGLLHKAVEGIDAVCGDEEACSRLLGELVPLTASAVVRWAEVIGVKLSRQEVLSLGTRKLWAALASTDKWFPPHPGVCAFPESSAARSVVTLEEVLSRHDAPGVPPTGSTSMEDALQFVAMFHAESLLDDRSLLSLIARSPGGVDHLLGIGTRFPALRWPIAQALVGSCQLFDDETLLSAARAFDIPPRAVPAISRRRWVRLLPELVSLQPLDLLRHFCREWAPPDADHCSAEEHCVFLCLLPLMRAHIDLPAADSTGAAVLEWVRQQERELEALHCSSELIDSFAKLESFLGSLTGRVTVRPRWRWDEARTEAHRRVCVMGLGGAVVDMVALEDRFQRASSKKRAAMQRVWRLVGEWAQAESEDDLSALGESYEWSCLECIVTGEVSASPWRWSDWRRRPLLIPQWEDATGSGDLC
jgi:hypothetical protein